jgi:hypothetical protein
MHRLKFPACFGLLLICISLSASVASAQAVASSAPAATPVNSTAITGVYIGNYRCARGPVNLKLTLAAPGDGSLTGVFMFDLPANSRTRTASYTLSGTYDAATGKFRLNPVEWEPPAPPGFVMVGIDGAFNSRAEQVFGKITGGYGACTTFAATRDKAQTAALPKRPALTPVAPAVRSAPTNATSMSRQTIQHSPSSASAAPSPVAPAAQPPAAAAGQNVPAQARVQPGTIYLCSTSTNNEPSYRSGVFHVAANTSLGAINDAFQNYLRKNYHVDFNSACMDMFYDPDGQRYIQAEQGAKNKRKIVIVDWKYVPGQDSSLPAPVAPTPVASGKGSPTYCSGAIRGGDMYFSDIFEVPPENDDRESNVRQDYRFGFGRFVVDKYGLDPGRDGTGSWDGGVMCVCAKKTFTECRSDKDQSEQYYREKSHGGYKIIETGWNGSGRLGP